MTVRPSRVRKVLDVDPSVTLRSTSAGNISATTTETAIQLNEIVAPFWADGNEVPYGELHIPVNVTFLDRTTLDETYVLALLVDDTAGLSDTPVVLAQMSILSTGFYEFIIDSKSIPALNPDNSGLVSYLGIRATLAGTTPILNYSAWLAKSEPN